jgi:hypothetical protein
MREHPGEQSSRNVGRRHIGRKIVRFGNVLERFVTDDAARLRVIWRATPQRQIHAA